MERRARESACAVAVVDWKVQIGSQKEDERSDWSCGSGTAVRKAQAHTTIITYCWADLVLATHIHVLRFLHLSSPPHDHTYSPFPLLGNPYRHSAHQWSNRMICSPPPRRAGVILPGSLNCQRMWPRFPRQTFVARQVPRDWPPTNLEKRTALKGQFGLGNPLTCRRGVSSCV